MIYQIPKEICPRCGEQERIEQTADHNSKGYNGFKCKKCGCEWGN